jgi:hypothetical protein
VYPAAGLIDFTNAKTPIYYIDPKPIKINLRNFGVIPEIASEGMKQLKKHLSVLFKSLTALRLKHQTSIALILKLTAHEIHNITCKKAIFYS